jgi:hypothetical protein
VSLTIDPLPTNQLNLPAVTVTGTVGAPSYNVWANGVAASVNDDGTWEADNVPVNPSGTAIINAEAGTDLTNILAAQTLDQPQPAVVSLESIFFEYETYSYAFVGCGWFAGNTFYSHSNFHLNWNDTSGGLEADSSYGLNGDLQKYSYSDINPLSVAGGLGYWSVPWMYADFHFNEADDSCGIDTYTGPLSARTQVVILPSGQTQAGTTNLYLVSASAMEYSDPDNAIVFEGGDVPLPAAWLTIQGQPLTNNVTTNDDGSIWGATLVSSLAGTPAVVTPVATQVYSNNLYSFNVLASNVSFQLTILSNSATQIDATNWAAVMTNDYVTLQAVLSDTNALPFLTWSGGGQAVPGNPLQWQVSKATSQETTVTASLGSSNLSLNVWVIWANLTINTSTTLDPDDKASILDNGNWPTPSSPNYSIYGAALGGGNTLGPINCLSDSNLTYAFTVGRIEAKATLTPAGVGSLLTTNWDLRRTSIVVAWDNGGHYPLNQYGNTNGPWTSGPAISNPSPGVDDTSQPFAKYLIATNGDIFDLDAPGCSIDLAGTNIIHTAEVYDNFFEYATVNLGGHIQTCSTSNVWSYTAQIDIDSTNEVPLNAVSASLITIPSSPHYSER